MPINVLSGSSPQPPGLQRPSEERSEEAHTFFRDTPLAPRSLPEKNLGRLRTGEDGFRE